MGGLKIICCLMIIFASSVGCINYYESPSQGPPQPYQQPTSCDSISQTISGVGQRIEISEVCPVRLVISGVDNEIYIHRGTAVTEIIVSGVSNTIYLPRGVSPRIVKSGVEVNIIYYD